MATLPNKYGDTKIMIILSNGDSFNNAGLACLVDTEEHTMLTPKRALYIGITMER